MILRWLMFINFITSEINKVFSAIETLNTNMIIILFYQHLLYHDNHKIGVNATLTTNHLYE